ncbi:hypothetical protein GGR50DRAFT_630939 [Xylaria sp. CBS 124048]|nr:hypothetical protein GGR50DRAFT_630939 [Xylaria sp. CBS 124048]
MPKRSYDEAALMPTGQKSSPLKIQKTERSHEENQERAYIAASRRADRSIEARLQSAKMASEIHQKRTGRRLRVSEEIVLREEMYEEMEDDMPRPYRYLATDLQTESTDLNHRVGAYIASKSAMATMAKYNEVNKIFNEAFAYPQRAPQPMYMAPPAKNSYATASRSGSVSCQSSRNHSLSTPSQCSELDNPTSKHSPSHTPTTTASLMTPNHSPTATSTDTLDQPCSPYHMQHVGYSNFPLDPELAQQQPSSSFTSRLPNEVRLMANLDMSDPLAMHFLGGDLSPFQADFCGGVTSLDQLGLDGQGLSKSSGEYNELYLPSLDGPIDLHLPDDLPNDGIGHYGTSACGDWETYVDFDTER